MLSSHLSVSSGRRNLANNVIVYIISLSSEIGCCFYEYLGNNVQRVLVAQMNSCAAV